MAVINSALFQKGSKSLGNLTMRDLRGQTVLSLKIVRNNSKTHKQKYQRNGFAETVKTSRSLRPIIEIGYKKLPRGSKMSHFVQVNTAIAEYARRGHLYDLSLPPITNLCRALDDPAFKGKIYTGVGEYDVNAIFGWSPEETLTGTLRFRRDFMAGDVITIGMCYSFVVMGDFYEHLRLFEKTLTAEEVEALADKQKFVINETSFPGLDILSELDTDASNVEILATALVTTETQTSTSVLMPMPDVIYQMKAASQTRSNTSSGMVITDSDPDAFGERLNGRLEGSFLRMYETMPDEYYDFPFDLYNRDINGKINGMDVAAPKGSAFVVMEDTKPAVKSYIMKDELILAEVTNILIPALAT